ncbi:hypothetical protein ACE1OC_00250 [Streptomyces sp. DSM 116496]|uniref:hypothetical protein n=1 Tax=Streptomyces stoeckheimensis TaxID=3344656 RepID=UPI0038B3B635
MSDEPTPGPRHENQFQDLGGNVTVFPPDDVEAWVPEIPIMWALRRRRGRLRRRAGGG